jgi:Diaminopimelate decarboxylase
MTARIRDYLKIRRESGQDEGPVLVVDLDVVRTNYQNFAKALPDTRVFYAVKANPAPEVLALLAKLGSCFDTASVPEIEMALAAGASADRISYGNTIKKERDVARAYAPRRATLRRRLQGRGREGRPRGARLAGVLPHPLRLRWGGMAVVAQVRLRARHGRGRAGARP